MGKRSDFERKPRDFYPTPRKAVLPLLPYLEGSSVKKFGYAEPFAGNGALMDHLKELAGLECIWANDIDPQREDIEQGDVLTTMYPQWGSGVGGLPKFDHIITNPAWDRKILHPFLDRFLKKAEIWLLLDAGWAHTLQAVPYIAYCSQIVPIGRVKWIEDSKHTGKDDVCWYKFEREHTPTTFHPRTKQ